MNNVYSQHASMCLDVLAKRIAKEPEYYHNLTSIAAQMGRVPVGGKVVNAYNLWLPDAFNVSKAIDFALAMHDWTTAHRNGVNNG